MKQNKYIKQNHVAIYIVMCMAGYHIFLFFIGGIPGCPPPNKSQQAKESLIILHNTIKISDTYKDVCETVAFYNPHNLSLGVASWDANVLVFRTPFHISTKNWIMYIEFDNSSVVGKYIRYYDSGYRKPADAPTDSLAEGYDVNPKLKIKWEG